MSALLAGRSCVVTGAANGIGRAIAERFLAEEGYVVGLDVAAPTELPDHPNLKMLSGSVAEEDDVRAAIQAAVEWRGSLDVMVNNAGIQLERSLAETTTAEFDQLVAVNLRGTFIGVREAAAAMGDCGSIVNLSSVLATTADPLLGAYCATKGGVANLTRAGAVTYGRQGIRVNAVCPGAVATPLTTRVWEMADDPQAARQEMESLYPMGRIVAPEEVAAAVAFLASEMASGVTGSSVTVDCGLTAANPEFALMRDLI
jgi:NAD(P)-dependent dehydrogenase (short-subunit alcohol dehydrogenase family)